MRNFLDEIIATVGYGKNYHGLGLKGNNMALNLVSPLFIKEGIDMADWYVFAIAVIDDSGKFPEAVNVSMINRTNKKRLDFYFREDGSFHSVTVMDGPGFPKRINSIAEANN